MGARDDAGAAIRDAVRAAAARTAARTGF